MSIVTTAELAAFMGVAVNAVPMQAALDIAEQQVSVWLGMREADGLGLARRTGVIKTFYVPFDAQAVEVPTGPLEAVTACEVNSVAQTLGAGGIQIRTPWSITYDPTTEGDFARGARVKLTASIGYIASGSPGTVIPAAVKNAVLVQASGVYSNMTALATGQVKISESIGDYSVGYKASDTVETISPVLGSMLQGIRRAPFLGA